MKIIKKPLSNFLSFGVVILTASFLCASNSFANPPNFGTGGTVCQSINDASIFVAVNPDGTCPSGYNLPTNTLGGGGVINVGPPSISSPEPESLFPLMLGALVGVGFYTTRRRQRK